MLRLDDWESVAQQGAARYIRTSCITGVYPPRFYDFRKSTASTGSAQWGFAKRDKKLLCRCWKYGLVATPL
jgi:hypothetical protein